MATRITKQPEVKVPSLHDWRTTDADEINKRRFRAREESFTISNQEPAHPIFSNFLVQSASGMTYAVEIRDLHQHQNGCDCVDFRINGLGICKHVEAVLLHLEARYRRLFDQARKHGSTRLEVTVNVDAETLRVRNGHGPLPRSLQNWFDDEGQLKHGSPESAVAALQELRENALPRLRISREVVLWLENRRRVAERKQLRHAYEMNVQGGAWPAHETKVPLFPYQREGMLHLAFTERALLADEMGLGKTIQAIAACALLHRSGRAQCALVVTPASLKTEWEEQIQHFTDLSYQLVFGPRFRRLQAYSAAGAGASLPAPVGGRPSVPFFTLVNYEQMVGDALEVNARLQPDIVVLDEAQRIKNWNTKTAQAVKRLRSRYAFVLTGTPIENRIDEIHSLMDFLNPSVLGPLFRFNRDFYEFDERGRPSGFRQLDQLHARIKPYLIRRRKADVETELPERTDRNHFVPLSDAQKAHYMDHAQVVMRLVQLAKRRPLTQPEQEKLQRELAMLRMICDTNFILDPQDRTCPKLAELEKILEECCHNDAKVIVFSEWERMLQLVRELCGRLDLGYAWHTGSVPQLRRRAEINAFKSDPHCRVFLSTDSGSTGLNLQNASVVINCDLPWNPARLEQRIARAWRKHQTRPVTVINLVSENTIEQRMLDTLANKQALADGVLDLKGNLQEIKLRGGRQAFLAKLQQLLGPPAGIPKSEAGNPKAPLPADRALGFSQRVREKINGALLRCEERYPAASPHSVLLVVVERDAPSQRENLAALHAEFFGPGQADPLAPVQLEVIDRATDEALQRLLAAGLVSLNTRASRPLYPTPEGVPPPPPLSEEEQQRAASHRERADYALRMAKVLGAANFLNETRRNLLDAILHRTRALAVEQRLPEPGELNDALLPPLAQSWKGSLALLRTFAANSDSPWQPVAEALAAR